MKRILNKSYSKEIKGVKYEVENYFNGDKEITEKVGKMIIKDFLSGDIDEPEEPEEEESSLDFGMDGPAM